jgi:hypothetical protein
MQPLTRTAPVPAAHYLPARAASRPDASGRGDPYALAAGATRLHTSAEVERYLPDILGRALARAWIDTAFRARFCADPRATLAAHQIELPDMIRIEVVTHRHTRPMVVVSELQPGNAAARRLLYLQLVMVAGK